MRITPRGLIATAFGAIAIGAVALTPRVMTAQGGSAGAATAKVDLKNAEGKSIGSADLRNTPNGVLVMLHLSGAPAGEHAFHVHETGRCEAPTFKSAGGHFNPTKAKHGFADEAGPHAGDLPNLHIPQNGRLDAEFLLGEASLGGGKHDLLDADGAALVLHAKADDYRTDPAGDAGDRVACGVIGR